jgi:TniQ
MLSFFPNLYPDELLYSGLARYHIRSGNKNFRQTDLDLFGYSSGQACRVTLTNNLKGLVKQIAHISYYRVRWLMENHTLYPFYAAFLSPIEIRQLELATIEKRSGSILDRAKVDLDSYNDYRKYLKFCPLCLKAEIDRYGEPYWHRCHQIPGITICTDHQIPLLDSSIPIDGKGIHYHAASLENCPIDREQIELAPESVETLLRVAEDILWLMNSQIDFQGMRWLRDRYLTKLHKLGLAQKLLRGEFQCDWQQLFESFCTFYGKDCLNLLEPRFIQTEGNYLLHCILSSDLDPKIDRVAHVLITRYLSGSVANFFMQNKGIPLDGVGGLRYDKGGAAKIKPS